MSNWLAICPPDNLRIGLQANVWGFDPRYQKAWSEVEGGHSIFFYAMLPVSGVVGYGLAEETFVDSIPFWPEEKKSNGCLWPMRIRLREFTVLPDEKWDSRKVPLKRKGITMQRAFQRLRTDEATSLRTAIEAAILTLPER